MWLLMLKKDWSEMDLQTKDGKRARVKGYMLPIEGGGRIQADAFMPLFTNKEHAEAARGPTNAPIYEVCQQVQPDIDPDSFLEYDPDGDVPI